MSSHSRHNRAPLSTTLSFSDHYLTKAIIRVAWHIMLVALSVMINAIAIIVRLMTDEVNDGQNGALAEISAY